MALKSVGIIRVMLSQRAIAPLIDKERLLGPEAQTDEEIMAYVRQYGRCDYHPVGTCKMGVDEEAVVDPQLRVHGFERLRVIDS